MKGMKKEHNKDTIDMIKYIISHGEYEKYINVFDRDTSTSIIDIEEGILLALKKGD
jgi:hypothetical protein